MRLMSLLKRERIFWRAIIKVLLGIGFFKDIPDEASRALVESVLMALPAIRNRLGGHGQGDIIVYACAGCTALSLIEHAVRIAQARPMLFPG